MIFNLIVLICINIVYQNQQVLLGFYEAGGKTPSNPNNGPPATICVHDAVEKDYWETFKNNFNQEWLIIIQSMQIFIFIPSLFGTIMVLNYSGKLITKYYNNMKLLLSSYDESKS
jgi:hypothetical protein